MKVIDSRITKEFEEITIRRYFLFIYKYDSIYRKVDGVIYGWTNSFGYYTIGISQTCDILPLFKFCK